jgi:hypothetical protein
VQNYSKDHKDIELLRLKSFTISKPFTDKDVLSPEFLDAVANVFKHMEPLVSEVDTGKLHDALWWCTCFHLIYPADLRREHPGLTAYINLRWDRSHI